VVGARRLNHLLAFDEPTGILTCEGGVMLADILETFLPRGWFAPVTPGTRFVTVGGMIASDVHGKNHHRVGSFGDHLAWVELALPDGRVVRCSAEQEPELLAATCGGMGLTGVIVRAAFRMLKVESAHMRTRTLRAADLGAAFEAFEAAGEATYSVAWIDALARGRNLGRSVIFLGEHARPEELPASQRSAPFACKPSRARRVPVDFPDFALSRLPVSLFNAVYNGLQQAGDGVSELYPYFYPLDAILDWNRIYGRRGFMQHQSVLPLAQSAVGIRRLLEAVSAAGGASFLTVLKRMGPVSFGHLSFPMEGYTLAMDFPNSAQNLALLARLDGIVADHGGRIYLSKDARAAPSAMDGYPRLEAFRTVRRRFGLTGKIESLQSRRLEI
jgi:FAD/FMN-containing dehydrogenase